MFASTLRNITKYIKNYDFSLKFIKKHADRVYVRTNNKEENEMTNINPLNFGVQGNPYLKKDTQDDLAKETLSNPKKEQEVTQANSNELLGYMAAVNSDIIPQKVTRTVEVKKYVNDEQAARIEDFKIGRAHV